MISFADKLQVIAFFSATVMAACLLALCSTPGRGYMRVLERTAAGAGLCAVCSLLCRPLGVEIAQSPLSALTAGFFGLPGVALSTFLSLWP